MAARATGKTAESSDKVSVICRALRRAIIEQALEPGAKLPEDSLGERFGVSRTIARHALGQLAAEGLVELRRNRIAVVATPSWQEARDAFDIRIQLERPRGPPARGQADQEPDRRAERPCRCRGPRARRHGRGLDPARHRIPHPARADDEQPDPGALCQRGRLSLLPDAVALQPAAFDRMRDQRAPRHHRSARQGRRGQGDGA